MQMTKMTTQFLTACLAGQQCYTLTTEHRQVCVMREWQIVRTQLYPMWMQNYYLENLTRKMEILFENHWQLKGCIGGRWGLLTMGPAGAWQSKRESQEIHEPPKHHQRFPAFIQSLFGCSGIF